mmetsp:Transcript_21844/g.35528  ORF Transcript_21844/g.35528 Transcript_21844/m.35528 type:complete len:196 (-) Transcript_21844:184-771(-)
MDFEGGTPGKTAISDVAFVQDETREILIVGASTDNHVVLVDLKTFETRKLNVAPGVAESTGGGSRKLEWAIGTDYVWVNGGESKEAYILKITGGIETAVVDQTLIGITAGNMLFVNNFERLREVLSTQQSANTDTANVSSIVALVLGSLGLLAGLGSLMVVMNQKNSASELAVNACLAPGAVDIESKSLGSKMVN